MKYYGRIEKGYLYCVDYATLGLIIPLENQREIDLDLTIIEEINKRPFYKIYDTQGNLNQEHLDKYNKYKENEELLPQLYIDMETLKSEYQITDNDLTAINLGIVSQEVIDNYKAYYLKANELQQEINTLESENKEILDQIHVS